MKKFLIALLCLIFTSCCFISTGTKTHQVQNDNYFESVVKLFSESVTGRVMYSATGFAIDKETIMTAGHFCIGVEDGYIKGFMNQEVGMIFLNNNDELVAMRGIKMVKIDEKSDLCILKKERHGLKPLKFIDSYDNLKIGNSVIISGSPIGIYPVVEEGKIVSLGGRYFNGSIIISGEAYPGNSGSPVLYNGKVIGVLVAGTFPHSNIIILTGINDIKKFLNE